MVLPTGVADLAHNIPPSDVTLLAVEASLVGRKDLNPAIQYLLLAAAAYDHAKYDGYFWNKIGLEYPAMWAIGVLYFAIHGGGPISLDRLIGWQF